MRSKYKSLIAFLLVAVMVFTMLPTSVANAGAKKGKKSSQLVTGAVVGTEGVVEMEPTEDKGTATTKSNGKFEAVTVPSGSEEEILVGDEATDANNGSKYLQSLFAAPLVNDGETGDPPPEFTKNLVSNGDGTYTLSLSVRGSKTSDTTTKINKANVILVLDTSSSMNNNAGNTYYKVTTGNPGDPDDEGNVKATYYRLDGTTYRQLYYRNGAWRQSDDNNGTVHNGDFYTRSRLWAEKHALTDDDGIIDNLLKQNVADDPDKSDIIEVALVDFNGVATKRLDFSTNGTTIKNTINNLKTDSGTNWEESLVRAQSYIDGIPEDEADEKTYVIFLTDGEPTAYNENPGPYTGNGDRERMWGYASDNAKDIVDGGAEFYGLYTWGNSTYRNYLSGLVEYAYTGSGDYTTSPDDMTAAYKKYFTDASSTEALIEALKQIASSITDSVGYEDVGISDGVTAMTHSNIKASVSGGVTGINYYKGTNVNPAEGNYGDVWADAPQATFTNGTVDWKLGETFELENDVTYTITFVVWPDQDSLNLVADLNNGIKQYSELTADEKAQIKEYGTGDNVYYKLKTNVDYPTVSYRTVKTHTVDGQATTVVSEPQSSKIDNPDPVALAGAKMNAKKLWEDSLDPSQREDEVKNVQLLLKVDNDYFYKDAQGKPVALELTPPDWTKTDYIAIAPGLLVTDKSPAYDATAPHFTYNGTTYCMLESGHEYVFEENDINQHFELTAYTHHPMIMGVNADGSLIVKDVIFTKNASNQITGIEAIKDMEDSISATNMLKGGINISKKVVDSTGAVVDSNDSFKVKVNLVDDQGNALPTKTVKNADESTTSYTIDYRIYYGQKNPAYATSGTQHRSDHIYKTGTSFEETIYVGDVIRVVNVETNAVFNVEEEVPAGYDSNSFEYKISTGVATAQAEAAAKAYVADDTVEIGGKTYYRVKGNSACYAYVTNKLPAAFYVYHSSDNTVERIPMNDSRVKTVNGKKSFNIVDETKAGFLYGGYYKGYSLTEATEAEIKAGFATKNGSTDFTYPLGTDKDGNNIYSRAGGMWKTDDKGTPYEGDLTTWNKDDAQKGAYTADGTKMEPEVDHIYYLKEVPEIYLSPAAYTVYDLNDVAVDNNKDFYQVKKLYLLSLTDDANYVGTGFDVVASSGLTGGALDFDVAWGDQIDVTQSGKSGNYDTLVAKSVTGEENRAGLITAKDVTTDPNYIVENKYFRHTPYHITPDNIKVTAVKRMLVYVRNTRFNEDWIRPGMTKTFTGTKSAYAAPAPLE